MKITPDTNLLVRIVVEDEAAQAKAAQLLLKRAQTVALSTASLCELAWVLTSLYRRSNAEIAQAIRLLINSATVSVDIQAVQAGLALLDQSGDFADGVIACEGRSLGGEEFVSFDRRAVSLLQKQGVSARLLA